MQTSTQAVPDMSMIYFEAVQSFKGNSFSMDELTRYSLDNYNVDVIKRIDEVKTVTRSSKMYDLNLPLVLKKRKKDGAKPDPKAKKGDDANTKTPKVDNSDPKAKKHKLDNVATSSVQIKSGQAKTGADSKRKRSG